MTIPIAQPPLLVTPAGSDELRRVAADYLTDEGKLIARLKPDALLPPTWEAEIHADALRLIMAVRNEQLVNPQPLADLLQHAPLASSQGNALFCLAEALLRIPDAPTARQLLHDLLSNQHWNLGDNSWLKLGSSALHSVERLLEHETDGEMLAHWLWQLLDPPLRQGLHWGLLKLARQFVLGQTLPQALRRRDNDSRYSFDMLGESALSHSDAQHYLAQYQAAISALANDGARGWDRPGVSVKLSALHPRLEWGQLPRLRAELLPQLAELAEAAADANLLLTFDAEESERLELSLLLFAELARSPRLNGWNGLGLAVQAYQRRAPAVLRWLDQLAAETGRILPVRLVKGAYWDSEIKRAQQAGLASYPVYTRKRHSDLAYLACARQMLAAPGIYPQFATHNAHSIAWVCFAARHGNRPYELQRLQGMGEALHQQAGKLYRAASRVYAPVGPYRELLPYLLRRLLENGANAGFIHRLYSPTVSAQSLAGHPAHHDSLGRPALANPGQLFPGRQNSEGFSMSDSTELSELYNRLHHQLERQWQAAPLLAGKICDGPQRQRQSPADRQRCIGQLVTATSQHASEAMANTHAAYAAWSARPVAERADLLLAVADKLSEYRDELLMLLIREAGKTLADALAEWREAVDYCRYYAREARRLLAVARPLASVAGEDNELWLASRGVFLTISPWNFPLAILLGQTVAALVCGNCVVVKPSRRTPLLGMRACQLLLEAGIPADVVAYLPGESGKVSAQLLADPRLAGVAFTGSHDSARAIARSLADRSGPLLPLIAETGGINALIADSSAHPQQLVQDIISSAFNSAGQRCSALRLLLIQDEIAEPVLTQLAGAMQLLTLGEPLQLATDIGPLIDQPARAQLEEECELLARRARLAGATPLLSGLDSGCYFAPRAYEIDLDDLPRRELFGPVLQIARWPAGALSEVIESVNGLGYGLTLGLASRLPSHIEQVRRSARVGNLYINRNQIGAAVESQPFGGEGLSGTGFKAGGPHYLLRFVSERTISNNTAAIGGNSSLLAAAE